MLRLMRSSYRPMMAQMPSCEKTARAVEQVPVEDIFKAVGPQQPNCESRSPDFLIQRTDKAESDCGYPSRYQCRQCVSPFSGSPKCQSICLNYRVCCWAPDPHSNSQISLLQFNARCFDQHLATEVQIAPGCEWLALGVWRGEVDAFDRDYQTGVALYCRPRTCAAGGKYS